MRPVVIFGASRGVGLALARLLRRRRVPVLAMLRSPSTARDLEAIGVRIMQGDAFSTNDIARVFTHRHSSCDVVTTLGGRAPDGSYVDDIGNINLIDQAVANKVGRFILVTSIGCGDMAPYRSARAIAAFGAMVDAKTRAEEHLRAAIPSATIVRPGGLRFDPATGRGILSQDPQIHGSINREDVAELIVRILQDRNTCGHSFAAVDSAMAHSSKIIAPFNLSPLSS